MTNREGMSSVLSVSPTVTYLHITVCSHTPAQTTGTPSQTENLPRTCLHTWPQEGTEGTLPAEAASSLPPGALLPSGLLPHTLLSSLPYPQDLGEDGVGGSSVTACVSDMTPRETQNCTYEADLRDYPTPPTSIILARLS